MEARPGIAETPKGFIRTFGPSLVMGAAMWSVLIASCLLVF